MTSQLILVLASSAALLVQGTRGDYSEAIREEVEELASEFIRRLEVGGGEFKTVLAEYKAQTGKDSRLKDCTRILEELQSGEELVVNVTAAALETASQFSDEAEAIAGCFKGDFKAGSKCILDASQHLSDVKDGVEKRIAQFEEQLKEVCPRLRSSFYDCMEKKK